jgi:hypothetical protein
VKQIRNRLTYANVMSSLAVFLVLGGATAFAATKIGANQLKANSVKTGKIVKEAVTTGKIKKNAVDGSRVKDGSLTGADINLGTLGSVPSANTVGGQALASFSKELGTNGPSTTAIDFGGVKLTATCPAGNPTLVATNTSGVKAAARLGSVFGEPPTAFGEGTSGFGTTTLTKEGLGVGNFEVVFETGKVTSIQFGYRDDTFNGAGCRFFGHVING